MAGDVAFDGGNGVHTPTAAQAAPTATTTKTRGTVARNPVIAATSRISTILDGFSVSERKSIFRFLAEQYGIEL